MRYLPIKSNELKSKIIGQFFETLKVTPSLFAGIFLFYSIDGISLE